MNGVRAAGAVGERMFRCAGLGLRIGVRADGVVGDWNARGAARPSWFLLQGSSAGARKVHRGLSLVLDTC